MKNKTIEEKILTLIDKEFDGDFESFLGRLKITPRNPGRPKNPRIDDVAFYVAIRMMTTISKPDFQFAMKNLKKTFAQLRSTAANMEQSSTPSPKKITLHEAMSTLIKSGDYPIRNQSANIKQSSTLSPKKITIPDAISILIKSGDYPTATSERFKKPSDSTLHSKPSLEEQLLNLYKKLQKEEHADAEWMNRTFRELYEK